MANRKHLEMGGVRRRVAMASAVALAGMGLLAYGLTSERQLLALAGGVLCLLGLMYSALMLATGRNK